MKCTMCSVGRVAFGVPPCVWRATGDHGVVWVCHGECMTGCVVCGVSCVCVLRGVCRACFALWVCVTSVCGCGVWLVWCGVELCWVVVWRVVLWCLVVWCGAEWCVLWRRVMWCVVCGVVA